MNNKNEELNEIKDRVRMEPYFLSSVTSEIADDKNFILELLDKKHRVLAYVSKRLQGDKEIVEKSVLLKGADFIYASDDLKNDKSFILKIYEQSPSIVGFFNEKLFEDKDFLKKMLLKNIVAYSLIDKKYLMNEDIISILLEKDPFSIFMFDNINIDIYIKAFNNNNYILHYIDESVSLSTEFLKAISHKEDLLKESYPLHYEELLKIKREGELINKVIYKPFINKKNKL